MVLHTRRFYFLGLFAFAAASAVADTGLCAVPALPQGNVVVALLGAAKTASTSLSPSPEATGTPWTS